MNVNNYKKSLVAPKRPAATDTIGVECKEITVGEEDLLARVISIPANTMSTLV